MSILTLSHVILRLSAGLCISVILGINSAQGETGQDTSLDTLAVNEQSATDPLGRTPLHLAAIAGRMNAVKDLVAHGADVNVRLPTGETPLHLALAEGHGDVAVFLIRNGADVNAKSAILGTPLHIAAQKGLLDVVQLLLEKGANPNVTSFMGDTPLFWAVEESHFTIAKALLDAGAHVNAGGLLGSPLHHAARKGRADIVKLLISRGANVNAKDPGGATPLDVAVMHNQTRVIKILKSAIDQLSAEVSPPYSEHPGARKSQRQRDHVERPNGTRSYDDLTEQERSYVNTLVWTAANKLFGTEKSDIGIARYKLNLETEMMDPAGDPYMALTISVAEPISSDVNNGYALKDALRGASMRYINGGKTREVTIHDVVVLASDFAARNETNNSGGTTFIPAHREYIVFPVAVRVH